MPKFRRMTKNETRSERLKQARIAAGFTSAAAAAERFGWAYPTYAQHESGAGLGKDAARYARAFKVSEAWLLTGEGAALDAKSAELLEIMRGLRPESQDRLIEYAKERRQLEDLGRGEEPPPAPPTKGQR